MFNAVLIEKDEAGYRAGVTEPDDAALPEGDVTVRADYSTLNYKDGLAITGKGPVVRKFSMAPGIDLAAYGFAQGMDFPSSVAPFILRGVTLAGVDSVMAPRSDRLEAWRRLAQDLDVTKLELMTHEIGLGEAVATAAAAAPLEGKMRTRHRRHQSLSQTRSR